MLFTTYLDWQSIDTLLDIQQIKVTNNVVVAALVLLQQCCDGKLD
jgi:hypothetical protein